MAAAARVKERRRFMEKLEAARQERLQALALQKPETLEPDPVQAVATMNLCKLEPTSENSQDQEKAEREAVEERKKIMEAFAEAEKQLNALIKHTMEQEAIFNAREEERVKKRRLIVTNIAADANEDDIWDAYHDEQKFIDNIRLLDERKPIARTRTAYVDFRTRDKACSALWTRKFIFGMLIHPRLAFEDGEEWLKFLLI